ncbi:hypothetical protein MP228_008359 [Amoeboaphelidium protococcarum]|nr:hypothetical protein MP228_008359 [Amoeboaphelidium protococcarum]
MEQNLLTVREVQVFRIPPRTTNRGYKASEWDVNQHLWSGSLRVVQDGGACYIKLEDPSTGQLFAQTKYDAQNTAAVEPVADSSRYFVLRIDDASTGRHAFVGLGFQERNDSFDFNVVLQDSLKHVQQNNANLSSSKAQNTPTQQTEKVDFSLKQGQKISVNIKGLKKKGDGAL